MSIKHTNILVPYTLESGRVRSMNFLCEYITKTNLGTEKVYTTNISNNITYNGFSNNVIYKKDPMSFDTVSIVGEGVDNSSPYFIRVYFPVEGTYTYTHNTLFHINIYTYLSIDNEEQNKSITKKYILYDNVLDNLNNLACAPKIYNSIRYQEYQDIRIIDLEEIAKTQSKSLNYLLCIEIQPVIRENNTYSAISNTSIGSSFISFLDHHGISIVNSIDKISRRITSSVTTNNPLYESLNDYINSICVGVGQDRVIYFRFFLVNRYSEEVLINKSVKYIGNNTCSITIDNFIGEVFSKLSEPWDLWCTEFEGSQISSYIEVYDKIYEHYDESKDIYYIEDVDPILKISSQPLSLVKDKFQDLLTIDSDLTIEDSESLKNKIDDIMENIVINNQIVKQNIIVSQTEGQGGIIRPTFYKAYDINEIKLHRDMIENVCINLDDYCDKVDKFYIKLCGNFFSEYTRTIDGVVFNINSSVVTSNTGSFYICDENKEYITSGKYICE